MVTIDFVSPEAARVGFLAIRGNIFFTLFSFLLRQQHRELTELTFRSGRRWRCSLTCSCLISLPVSPCDGAHRPADVVVDMILQVCEGYAHRPIGSGKAAAVKQHNAVVLGEPKHDI